MRPRHRERWAMARALRAPGAERYVFVEARPQGPLRAISLFPRRPLLGYSAHKGDSTAAANELLRLTTEPFMLPLPRRHKEKRHDPRRPPRLRRRVRNHPRRGALFRRAGPWTCQW